MSDVLRLVQVVETLSGRYGELDTNHKVELEEEKTRLITSLQHMERAYNQQLAPESRPPPPPRAEMTWRGFHYDWSQTILNINSTEFGNGVFRPSQREIINATMNQRDVFVVMPSGAGKSITYQLPAFVERGLTLIISPHLSLIKNQITHLTTVGLSATYIHAEMPSVERREILDEILRENSRFRFLFITPERYATMIDFLKTLYERNYLKRIVIDEAHCVLHLGHNYRTHYLSLQGLKQNFPLKPVMALTATSTKSEQEKIIEVLGLENCSVFRRSCKRSHLRYIVVREPVDRYEQIAVSLETKWPLASGIIYCHTKSDCIGLAERLKNRGLSAECYHSGMTIHDRELVLRRWTEEVTLVICSTVSFEMGIDKSDVKFIIHHKMPQSIESYYHACGRAGRNGMVADCVLYYSRSDYNNFVSLISRGGDVRIRDAKLEKLLKMVRFIENTSECRHSLQLFHFGEKVVDFHCFDRCDNCGETIRQHVLIDITEITKDLVEIVRSFGNTRAQGVWNKYDPNQILSGRTRRRGECWWFFRTQVHVS